MEDEEGDWERSEVIENSFFRESSLSSLRRFLVEFKDFLSDLSVYTVKLLSTLGFQ